jgi:hypothetical protein
LRPSLLCPLIVDCRIVHVPLVLSILVKAE